MKQNAASCRCFVLFSIDIIFKITMNFLLFSLISFLGIIVQACNRSLCQAQASIHKNQMVLPTKISGTVRHFILDQILCYFMHKVCHTIPVLPETQKN